MGDSKRSLAEECWLGTVNYVVISCKKFDYLRRILESQGVHLGVLSWITFPTSCFLISLFSLMFLSPVRFWSSHSDPLSYFYSLLIVDPSWLWNILDMCESLHLWDLSDSLGPSYHFGVSNHASGIGLMTVLLKWFSNNLWLTPNLIFCWQTLPRHYLLS